MQRPLHRKPASRLLTALLVLLSLAAASAAPRLGAWNEAARRTWWRERPDGPAMLKGGAQLLDSLRDIVQQRGLERALSNPHFMGWLGHLRWVRLLPEEPAGDDYFSKPENLQRFRQLSASASLTELVARSLSTADDGPRVAQALCEIAAAHPAGLADFPALAVAIAVVMDQPFPDAWPHPNVDRGAIPTGNASPAERFGFIVASQRARKLLIDPRALTVRELTFVVDTPVELRELAYAQQIKLGSIPKLESLYRAVPYDNARIAGKNYAWPHGQYRLVEVGRRGGICMDQAYFVSHTGKAQGVPTVLFMGQGRSGDHAWVGFLTARGRWTLDAARYRGENYPTGFAFDPQTWSRFTDAQMEYTIKGEGDSPSAARARLILGWAAMNADRELYPAILHAAQAAAPRSFEAWELEGQWLASQEPDLARHRQFWQRWIANFGAERDMKAKGQRSLLRTLRVMGEEVSAERLAKQIVAENKSKRFDLGIAVAADVVFEKQQSGEWEAAGKEFARVMKRFERNAGGHLFYNLVQPYVQICLREGRVAEARAGIVIAGKTLKPQPSSILANDLAALAAEAGAGGS